MNNAERRERGRSLLAEFRALRDAGKDTRQVVAQIENHMRAVAEEHEKQLRAAECFGVEGIIGVTRLSEADVELSVERDDDVVKFVMKTGTAKSIARMLQLEADRYENPNEETPTQVAVRRRFGVVAEDGTVQGEGYDLAVKPAGDLPPSTGPSSPSLEPTDEHPHLIDGEFQSDKYPTTPRNAVPLKTTDPMAQDLLWEYAHRHREVDPHFSFDLRIALRNKGYQP